MQEERDEKVVNILKKPKSKSIVTKGLVDRRKQHHFGKTRNIIYDVDSECVIYVDTPQSEMQVSKINV